MTSQTIKPKPGRIGKSLMLVMALLAMLGVWASGLNTSLQLLLSATAVLTLFYSLRTWPIHRHWRQLRLGQDGILHLTNPLGQTISVEPTRSAFLSPLFISFQVSTPDQRRLRISAFFDQFEPHSYRDLLRWIRYQG